MEDKEILGELKQCYELLQDIIDNADDTQLKSVIELMKSQKILEDKYEEIYEKIKNENDISLYYEENIIISPKIYYDYIINSKTDNEQYITQADLGEEKWWTDFTFLRKF